MKRMRAYGWKYTWIDNFTRSQSYSHFSLRFKYQGRSIADVNSNRPFKSQTSDIQIHPFLLEEMWHWNNYWNCLIFFSLFQPTSSSFWKTVKLRSEGRTPSWSPAAWTCALWSAPMTGFTIPKMMTPTTTMTTTSGTEGRHLDRSIRGHPVPSAATTNIETIWAQLTAEDEDHHDPE